MAGKWGEDIFPDHGVNRKVVDNDENYLYMKFQPKVMKHSRENGKAPRSFEKLLIKKIGFFGENRALSLFYTWNRLTFCKKSEKLMAGSMRTFVTYRRTDRQTGLVS